MGVSNFYSVNVKTPGQPATGGGQTVLGGAPQGLNFLEFIMAQLAQKTEAAGTGTPGSKEDGPLQSGNPLLAKDTKLDICTLVAANPEISEQMANVSAEEQTKLEQTLALNQQAFDDILKPLIGEDGTISVDDINALSDIESKTGGKLKLLDSFLIDGGSGEASSLDRLKAMLAKLEELAAESGSPVFVATNLTPEQITELQNILKGQSDKTLDDQAFAGVFIGLVQLVPPSGKSGLPQTVAEAEAAKAADTLASELNSIIPGGEGDLGADISPASEDGTETQFAKILKDATDKKNAAGVVVDKTQPEAKAALDGSVLQGFAFSEPGSLFTTPEWMNDFMERMGFQNQSAMHVSGLGQSVNIATHAGGATLPHPGTQMVAATLQKAASDGEAKNIVLQLDPPELGRIEIQMSFGKDKAVKAVMIAEKPETMAMLQRDAHVLERALTSTGFEADGALSFQLAQEGYDFNHNGRHDGHGGHGGGKDSADGETQLIETTMTWFVDPETGHMRYNFVA